MDLCNRSNLFTFAKAMVHLQWGKINLAPALRSITHWELVGSPNKLSRQSTLIHTLLNLSFLPWILFGIEKRYQKYGKTATVTLKKAESGSTGNWRLSLSTLLSVYSTLSLSLSLSLLSLYSLSTLLCLLYFIAWSATCCNHTCIIQMVSSQQWLRNGSRVMVHIVTE